MEKQYKDEDGFWRIGSVEITEDTKYWKEAKEILGKHLIKYPTSYHWLAFGWLDEDCYFIAKEKTYQDIN